MVFAKMVIFVFSVLWMYLFLMFSQQHQAVGLVMGDNKDLFEGDICNKTEGLVWTCRRAINCPSALADTKQNKRPPICSFDRTEPIICCPEINTTKPKHEALTMMNKSEAACQQYQDIQCKEFGMNRQDSVSDSLFAMNEEQFTTEGALFIKTEQFITERAQSTSKEQYIIDRAQSKSNEQSNTEVAQSMSKEQSTTEVAQSMSKEQYTTDGAQSMSKEQSTTEVAQSELFTPKIIRHSIMGGSMTKPKEYPHMALIGFGEESSISWSCGGSLISEQYVLSAAHCTNPGPLVGPARWVRLGDLNIARNDDDAKPQQYAIVSRINHPDYKPPALYNDIALYKLNQSVTYDEYVSPVCLHSVYTRPFTLVTAIGFGRIEASGPKSNHLLKVDITIVAEEECNELIKQATQLPRGVDADSMICAGEVAGGKDTCQGDSGGPLMLHTPTKGCVSQQIGITSFGSICGLEKSPGVYTRVSKFIPWIESIVWP